MKEQASVNLSVAFAFFVAFVGLSPSAPPCSSASWRRLGILTSRTAQGRGGESGGWLRLAQVGSGWLRLAQVGSGSRACGISWFCQEIQSSHLKHVEVPVGWNVWRLGVGVTSRDFRCRNWPSWSRRPPNSTAASGSEGCWSGHPFRGTPDMSANWLSNLRPQDSQDSQDSHLLLRPDFTWHAGRHKALPGHVSV